MCPKPAHPFGELRRIRGVHSTFTRRNNLYGVEAKDGNVTVFAIAYGETLVATTESMGSIFNNFEAILLAKFPNRLHITRLAAEVHWDHDCRQCSIVFGLLQFGLQCINAQVVSMGIYVDKVDGCPTVASTISTRDEGCSCRPEDVPGAYAKS